MGKLVVSEFVTLDGVFEDPGGAEGAESGGWAFRFERGPVGDKFKLDELMAADALLLGRVTYGGFAAAWPKMEGANPFGEKMNAVAKYVLSGTLEKPEWKNTTTIAGERWPERVAALKTEFDGDVLVNGSGQLVRALGEHGLIDEYRLMVFPVVLGRGKRLFDGGESTQSLRLISSQEAGETLILTYTPRSVG
jgi:dihydrofolate reductase